MTEEITSPAPAVVTEAPVAAPAVTATAVEAAPAIETTVVEAAPVETVVTEAAKPDTLLAGDKIETKPTEAEKPVEAKTEEKPAPEAKVEEAVVEPVTIEPFTLPEGFSPDGEKLGEFTTALSEFATKTKVPQAEIQALGQQFLDKHISEMKRYTESLTTAWNKQKNDWKDAFQNSPEFANRTDTVVNSALDAITVFGGDAKQQSEFKELMESSGVGNHPAMIRLLSNIMLAKAEPKPLAAPQIATTAKGSKIERMYGAKKQ